MNEPHLQHGAPQLVPTPWEDRKLRPVVGARKWGAGPGEGCDSLRQQPPTTNTLLKYSKGRSSGTRPKLSCSALSPSCGTPEADVN